MTSEEIGKYADAVVTSQVEKVILYMRQKLKEKCIVQIPRYTLEFSWMDTMFSFHNHTAMGVDRIVTEFPANAIRYGQSGKAANEIH